MLRYEFCRVDKNSDGRITEAEVKEVRVSVSYRVLPTEKLPLLTGLEFETYWCFSIMKFSDYHSQRFGKQAVKDSGPGGGIRCSDHGRIGPRQSGLCRGMILELSDITLHVTQRQKEIQKTKRLTFAARSP